MPNDPKTESVQSLEARIAQLERDNAVLMREIERKSDTEQIEQLYADPLAESCDEIHFAEAKSFWKALSR